MSSAAQIPWSLKMMPKGMILDMANGFGARHVTLMERGVLAYVAEAHRVSRPQAAAALVAAEGAWGDLTKENGSYANWAEYMTASDKKLLGLTASKTKENAKPASNTADAAVEPAASLSALLGLKGKARAPLTKNKPASKKAKTAAASKGQPGKVEGLTFEQHRCAFRAKVKGSIKVAEWAIEAKTHCVMPSIPMEFFVQLVVPNSSVLPEKFDASTPVVVASISGYENVAAVFGPCVVKAGTGQGSWRADKAEIVYIPTSGEMRTWWTMS